MILLPSSMRRRRDPPWRHDLPSWPRETDSSLPIVMRATSRKKFVSLSLFSSPLSSSLELLTRKKREWDGGRRRLRPLFRPPQALFLWQSSLSIRIGSALCSSQMSHRIAFPLMTWCYFEFPLRYLKSSALIYEVQIDSWI